MCDLEILDCLDHVVGELGQDRCYLLLGLHFVEGLKYRLLEVGQIGSFHGGGVHGAWRDGELSFGSSSQCSGAARRLTPFAPGRKLRPTDWGGNREVRQPS